MSQRDYILRIAEEVGRVLAQVIYRKQLRDYQGALNLIDEQFRQALGMGAGFIRAVPEETLLSMLTSLGTLNIEKCWLVATLLKAEGEIYESMGDGNESYYCYLKALNLFLEALLSDGASTRIDAVPEVEGLLYKLADYELPLNSRQLLVRYFERTEQYSRAEDTLFEI